MTTSWEMAAHLAVASDVFGGVFLCCPFSHEMSWMRSGTKMSRFLGIFSYLLLHSWNDRKFKNGVVGLNKGK